MSEECYETITTLTLQYSFSFDTPLFEVLEQLTRDARAYGYELDEDYSNIAKERIETHKVAE